jgi:hypothetical protein
MVAALLALGACGGDTKEPVAPAPTVAPTLPPDDDVQKDQPTTINVESSTPHDVLLDGKAVGKTPLMNLKVTPGPHDVTFIDEDGDRRTIGVVAEEGQNVSVRSDKAPKIREAPKK